MRRLTLAAGVACAVVLSNPVGAQFNTPSGGGGSTMPGRIVGSYSGPATPVGGQLPAAAPQAGQQIGGNGNGRPYDPTRPYDAFNGTGIDPSSLVAPLIGPDGKPVQPPDALDRMSDRIKSFFTGFLPESRPTFTPGIYRRNRERAEQRMWRRD